MTTGENLSTPNNTDNKWDTLSAESDAIWHFGQAREINQQFGEKIEKLNTAGTKMSAVDFERWEDEYAEEFNTAKNSLYNDGKTFEEVAELMQGSIAVHYRDEKNLMNTIEAQAGNYFYERRRDLYQAINDSDKSDEKKAEEKDYFNQLATAVFRHLSLKMMSPVQVREYGAHRHDEDQTSAHNEIITSLNTLNDLAKDYHLRPFTARNFVPSSAIERNKQTPAEKNIMSYDRYIVIAYYTIAFPDAVRKAEAEAAYDF